MTPWYFGLFAILLLLWGQPFPARSQASGTVTTVDPTRSVSPPPQLTTTRIRIGVLQDLRQLDPLQVPPDETPQIQRLLFEPLVRFDPDSDAVVAKGSLLERLQDRGGQEWLLVLQEGIQFSDGTPMDAPAVLTNLKRILEVVGADGRGGLLSSNLGDLAYSLVGIDARTIRIHLSRPFQAFPNILGSPRAGMVSPGTIAEGFRNKIVGSGPFRMTTRTAEGVELQRNPHFIRPTTHLDRLTVLPAPSPDRRHNWIRSRLGHIVAGVQSPPQLSGENQELKYGTILRAAEPGGLLIMLDSSRPPFDAPWFREAFFRALENDIFHSLANGKLEPARQIGPASSWIRTDLYHLPDPDPVQSRSIVQSASAANRPVVFNICIALDEMDLPRELRERFLVDFRFSLRKCGLIPFTEELSPEGLILASQREDRPQVLITRIRSRIDDLAFEFSSLFAAGHWGEPYLAPVLDSIRPLFSKAESATPVSARRFLYESLIESLGRERIMGFLALESRNVLVSSEILNVRLGLEGTLDLEDAVFEAER